jgi:hypothetical protein
MPQYASPLGWRFYQNFTHVIADYPEHPEGRRRWDERTFHPDRGGDIAPMSALWKNGAAPEFLKAAFSAALMATRVPLHGLLRRWKRKESDSLRLPVPAAWTVPGSGGRSGFGERAPETSLEECLYSSGEPAGD